MNECPYTFHHHTLSYPHIIVGITPFLLDHAPHYFGVWWRSRDGLGRCFCKCPSCITFWPYRPMVPPIWSCEVSRGFVRNKETLGRMIIANQHSWKIKFSSWRANFFFPNTYTNGCCEGPGLLLILFLSKELSLIYGNHRLGVKIVLIDEDFILQNTRMALISPDDWLIQTLETISPADNLHWIINKP